ncbi:MAG: glycine zipper 2TM domain-containing protein [Desulfobacteraceae bacterium]|nr:MAG: glycine zipper 2TM domain-containing protein [Desulfobacteraceae bacterium]
MKKYQIVILTLIFSFFLVSCAHYPPDRYNTQVGAAVGAGTGALIGQAIGGNTQSTLIGLAAGTIIGALVGNAVDQDYQVARDAARYGKPVIYYDKSGHAVEAIPEGTNDPNCQKVRKRVWEDGELVKETVEEVCGPPAPVVRYYPAPPPPPPYYYGWWGWPVVPRFSFYFGRSHHHGYYRHHRYPYYHGWHHR